MRIGSLYLGLILLGLSSCATKDFRDQSKELLVCSVISEENDKESKSFLTFPLLYSWKELENDRSFMVFKSADRIKVFIVHHFEELKFPHFGLIFWDFKLKENVELDVFKKQISDAVRVMTMENMYMAPQFKNVSKSVSDYTFVKEDGIDDLNYMKSFRHYSYNRSFLVRKGTDLNQAGQFCINKLEEDPPQVQEDEEFKMEVLRPI